LGKGGERQFAELDVRRLKLYGEDLTAIEWIEALAASASEILESSGSYFPSGEASDTNNGPRRWLPRFRRITAAKMPLILGINELAVFLANPKNSVQLSTIHSAKGLEWDAVALVDLKYMKEKCRTRTLWMWMSRAALLYCRAGTRAKKILMLFDDKQSNSFEVSDSVRLTKTLV